MSRLTDGWEFVPRIEPTDPRFWCSYASPASHVLAEVQRPAHMVDGNTLAVAVMKDWRDTRRTSLQKDTDNG